LSQNYYSRFNNTEMANAFIQNGKQAAANQDWMRLQDANIGLIRLLPDRETDGFRRQTGIGLV
jgi:hypothetical protein